MTEEDKAKELIEKFALYTNTEEELEDAKQCATITVDQIILEQCKSSELKDAKYQAERIDYWQEVKTIITNY